MTAPPSALGVLLLSVGLTLGASACSAPDAAGAAAAAERFHAAVRSPDGAAACGLLAPQTLEKLEDSAGAPCAEAIQGVELPAAVGVADTATYVRNARVALDGDVVFVSVFDGAWKVTAAGCSLQPDDSYDCLVEGG